MVTEISKGRDSTVPVFIGLSTDTKPEDVDNGSDWLERLNEAIRSNT